MVGAAINQRTDHGPGQPRRRDHREQFDSISPENVLKWERIHPEPDTYDFDLADQYVAFGEKHHMFIVGHCLVWHSQVPDWVFRDDKGNLVDRETLLSGCTIIFKRLLVATKVAFKAGTLSTKHSTKTEPFASLRG